jgi:hypothetical protein
VFNDVGEVVVSTVRSMTELIEQVGGSFKFDITRQTELVAHTNVIMCEYNFMKIYTFPKRDKGGVRQHTRAEMTRMQRNNISMASLHPLVQQRITMAMKLRSMD